MPDDVRRLRVEIVGGKEAEQQLDRLIAKRNQLFSGGGGGVGGGGGRPTAIGDPGTLASGPLGPVAAGPAAGARVTGVSQAFMDRAARDFLQNFSGQFAQAMTREMQKQANTGAATGNRALDVYRATGVVPRAAGGSFGGSSARDLELEGPEPFDESTLSPEAAAIARAVRRSERRRRPVSAFRQLGGGEESRNASELVAAQTPRGRALARQVAGIARADFAQQPTAENFERLLERQTLTARAGSAAALARQEAREVARNARADDAIARARAAVDDASLSSRVRLSRIQEGVSAARGQARAGFGDARETAEQLIDARGRINDETRQATTEQRQAAQEAARQQRQAAQEAARQQRQAAQEAARASRAPRATTPAATRPGGGQFGAGPFGDFNQAAFGPGIAALSLTFGLAPVFQGNQAVLNANRQFGPQSAARGQLSGQRTETLVELGRQADQTQQAIDGLTNRILRLAAAANLGGPLNAVANVGGGLAAGLNVLSPLAGGVAAFGAARAARSAATAATVAAGGEVAAAGAGAAAASFGQRALVLAARVAPPVLAAAGGFFGGQAIDSFIRQDSIRMLAERQARANGTTVEQERAAIVQANQQRQQVATGLTGPLATINERQLLEARRADAQPQAVAAEQELLQRRDALAGLESQRAQIRISRFQIDQSERFTREDQARDQFRLALGLGRQFEDIDRGQARRLEDIGISSGRARRDVGIRRADQGEDIARSAADARFDLGVRSADSRADLSVRTADSRADVGRNLGRSFRELDIGAGQSREDIERGFGENIQDLLLGQIGGLGGGIIRAAVGRQRALEALDRNVARQRGALTRRAGDQTEDIGIAEGRGIRDIATGEGRGQRDIATGEGRAVRDADLQAGRAVRDIGRGEGDAIDDAGRQTGREREDAILNFRRAADDLAEAQRTQTERQQANNAIQRAVLDEQERQLNRQTTLLTSLSATLAGLGAEMEREVKARQDFTARVEDLLPRLTNAGRRLASLPG